MEDLKVLTLIGGISRNSLNKSFFNSIQNLKPERFNFDVFEIAKLPFFSQDLENDPPDIVTEFKERIRECDAVLVITPEYNRSFPGVLKNAIDWGSRPYGHNLWDKKPAAIIGASIGNIGTFGAQHHLRQVFAYLNMYTLGQPEFYFTANGAFDEDGNFNKPSTIEWTAKYFEAFKEHILKISKIDVNAAYPVQGQEDSPSVQH